MIEPHKSERPEGSRAGAIGSTAGGLIVDDAGKAFKTLKAQFALRGHTLSRIGHSDGPPSFYAERWGLVRYLPTLDDVRRFLAQVGGGAA